MLELLVALLAPHTCLGCDAEGSLWCAACQNSAPLAAERCYRCHAVSAGGRTCSACRKSQGAVYAVQAATRYEKLPKQLVWKLKFERAKAGASAMASLMSGRLSLPTDGILTHIPTSTTRVRRRGYDQARLITQRLSKLANCPYQPLLLRLGRQEQHSASRQQRLTQLDQAFRPLHPELIRGQHIILVDDVVTTGATLTAAARALKAAGAKRVSAVVFAQA